MRKKQTNVRKALAVAPLVRKKQTNVRKALAVGGVSSMTDPCGSCFVWEVKGPSNSGSAQFDLRNPTSCDRFGTLAVSGFEDWRCVPQRVLNPIYATYMLHSMPPLTGTNHDRYA